MQRFIIPCGFFYLNKKMRTVHIRLSYSLFIGAQGRKTLHVYRVGVSMPWLSTRNTTPAGHAGHILRVSWQRYSNALNCPLDTGPHLSSINHLRKSFANIIQEPDTQSSKDLVPLLGPCCVMNILSVAIIIAARKPRINHRINLTPTTSGTNSRSMQH